MRSLLTSVPARILKRHGHGTLEGLSVGADQLWGIGRACNAKEQGRSHINKDNPPKDLADGLRHSCPRVPCLGRSDSDRLDSGIKGRAKDKDGGNSAEALAVESARVVPVVESKSVLLSNQPSRGVDDGEDEVGSQTNEFEESQPKLGLAKGADSQKLEAHKETPENEEPTPEGYLGCPVSEDAADDIVLVGEDGSPDDKIVPADGDGEGLVDHALGEGDEGATTREEGGNFTEGLHDKEGDDTDDAKADDERGRATVTQSTTSTDEQTRANYAGEGHHGQMAVLEATLDAGIRVMERVAAFAGLDIVAGVVGGLVVDETIGRVWSNGIAICELVMTNHGGVGRRSQ